MRLGCRDDVRQAGLLHLCSQLRRLEAGLGCLQPWHLERAHWASWVAPVAAGLDGGLSQVPVPMFEGRVFMAWPSPRTAALGTRFPHGDFGGTHTFKP